MSSGIFLSCPECGEEFEADGFIAPAEPELGYGRAGVLECDPPCGCMLSSDQREMLEEEMVEQYEGELELAAEAYNDWRLDNYRAGD